nr:uncharacterized protein LOC105337673 isoform X5 [Crassostrea gigas]
MENCFLLLLSVASLLNMALGENTTSKCYGNHFMTSQCPGSGRVIAVKKLQYGMKWYISDECPKNIESVQHVNTTTCCHYEEGDCLRNITDYNDKYLYLSRLSRLPVISQNTATPRQYMTCTNNNRTYSNYVQVVFDCVEEKRNKNFCSYQRFESVNGTVYLYREPYYSIQESCECRFESENASTIQVLAIDVRLQPVLNIADSNYTGECFNFSKNRLTFNDPNNNSKVFECENRTIYSEYEPIYSSSGKVLNVSYTEDGPEAQQIWILVQASKGKLEVECNPKLSTTTTFTTPATSAGGVITSKHTNSPNNTNNHTPGGHGHGNNIKTTNIPGKKDPALGEYTTSKCYGNHFMNSQCPGSGRVIAVKKLQYGMKWYISDECPKNIESVQHVNTTTCCHYEEGDCLRNITDYNDKYLYLSRLSRLPVISQNTATPRQYMTCTNNNRTYSNYVQVVFDCVEAEGIKNFCSYQRFVSVNGTVYLYREPYYSIQESCECRFESASDSTIQVLAIDVRLQPVLNISDSNYTGECFNYSTNRLTFNDGNNSSFFECENSTIYSEYKLIYSSSGNVLNVSYTEDGPEAQQIWILVQASKGKLEVECNPKLPTTTTFTTPATSSGGVITSKHTNSPNNTNNHTSGGHGHGSNIKTTNIPGKKDPALGEYTTSKCYGNHFMNSQCPGSGRVIAVKKLQYGMKWYISDECPKNIESVQHVNTTTCCQYEEGDCLRNITEYNDKYLYLSRLSRLRVISQNTATPRQYMTCANNNRNYSNYVQVVFDCVEEKRIKNFCSYQRFVSVNGTVYLYREPYYSIQESCECRFESASDSTIQVLAIDVRLQPVRNISVGNFTGECPSYSTNRLTFNDGNNSSFFECKNSTIYSEYELIYSSSGNVLNVSYTEDGLEAQQIWILVQASKGKLEVECNPKLSTTTTFTTPATSAGGGITSKHTNSPNNANNHISGGHGHGNNIKTTNIPGKKDPALGEYTTSKCSGNHYMNSQCPGSGRVIAIKKLMYGMKWYISDECPKNIESVQHGNTTTCCQYEEGDCLRNITDYNDKYLYLSRLSRLRVISQNTATPRQYMTCANNNRTYSNYVQVVFDCVKAERIKNFCNYQRFVSVNGTVYLYREPYYSIQESCECRFESASDSTIQVLAIDVRLQPVLYIQDSYYTGECFNYSTNRLTFNDTNNNSKVLVCENRTIYSEYEPIYSSSGNVLKVSYTEDGPESQQIWILVQASKGKLEVECNSKLSTTTTFTTPATSAGGGITSKHTNSPNNTNNHTSGGHGHGNNIKTTNIPGKKDPAIGEYTTSKCSGNHYMNSQCPGSGRVIAVKKLQYGMKWYISDECPKNIESVQHGNTTTCCQYEEGDCLRNITDYNDKYLYLSRLSRLPVISQNTATPRQYMTCANNNHTYSNYVQVVFDCVEEKRIKNLCSYQRFESVNGTVYLYREPYYSIQESCECRFESENASTIQVLAIDVRLQPVLNIPDSNYTGECVNYSTNRLTFNDPNNNSKVLVCENRTIYSEYEPIYSSSGNVLNVLYTEDGPESQQIWILVQASKGKLEVECNPKLSTTTTSTTSATSAGGGITSKHTNSPNNTNNHTPGGHGHSNDIKTTNIPRKKDPALGEYTTSKCYGNHFMNSRCPGSGRVIAVKKLQYGMKWYISDECPKNIESLQHVNTTTCCQYEEGDCLRNITDYNDKYLYLSRLSRLPVISQNTATPRQYMTCTNNNRTYSNYVQVVFDCVEAEKIKSFCSYQRFVSVNGTVYLYREPYYSIQESCECRFESASDSTIQVLAIDVRLQPVLYIPDSNYTGECFNYSTNRLTFNDTNNNSKVLVCENRTIYSEYEPIYSSSGNVLNVSYTEDGPESQQIWILVQASKGKLEVECNPKLSTTTTFTTPATSAGDVITSKHTNSPNNTNNHTPGGHGHGNNIKTTNIPGKKDPALGEYTTSKCYGNHYMNSQCPGADRVIAVKKLQYGMKWYISDECPKNIESVQHGNTTTCCQYEEGDCLRNITEYNDKYLYLSRLSRLPGITQNTATPRQYMTCTNNTRTYSNYVQVVFDCVEAERIKNFCSYQRFVSVNGTVYLYREPYYSIQESCECRFESENASTIHVFAIDVRLQPVLNIPDSNYTGECFNYSTNRLTFNDGNNSSFFECENRTIYSEYEPIYSSSGNALNVSYTEDGPEAQQIWILVQASEGKLEVECNPKLSTTTTFTTPATSSGGGITSKHTNSPNNTNNHISGGHGHGNNIKTTNIPGKKDPGSANSDHVENGRGSSARAERRAVENAVLYTVIGVAALVALLIVMAGVFIRRTRRSAKQRRKVNAIMVRSDSSILTLEKLPREIIGQENLGYTDHLY